MEELLSLKWNNHSSTFLQVLCEVKNQQKYSDVTLACEGKFYNVHKIVLSSCSDYFNDIFDMSDGRNLVILLKDIKTEQLEAILDYMYMGEVNVKQDNLAPLIKVAECLQIKGLAVAEEPIKNSKCNKSTSHPRPRKRKLDDEYNCNTSPPAKVKANEASNVNKADVKNNEALNDFVEGTSIFVKEEESSSFFSVEDDHYQEHQTDEPDNMTDHLNCPTTGGGVLADEDPPKEDEPFPGTSYNESSSFEWQNDNSDIHNISQNYVNVDPEGTDMVAMRHQWLCHICDKRCASRTSLNNHTRCHTGEKPFACSFCQYRAAQKSALTLHMRTHTGEKPFECQFCDYRATQKGSIKMHMKSQHNC